MRCSAQPRLRRLLFGIFVPVYFLQVGCQESPREETEEAISEDATVLELMTTHISPKKLVETIIALPEEEVEAQWAAYRDAFGHKSRERRRAEIDRFDSVGDGVIDPEQMEDFVEAEKTLRREQTQNLREYLLAQYDTNEDGQLTRGEMEEVLAAFRRISALERNSDREKLARKTLELRVFDWENNGVLNPSEWVAAGRLRREAFRDGDPDEVITIPTPVRRRAVRTTNQ